MGKIMFDLNGIWRMRCSSAGDWLDAVVPGSVYSNLLVKGLMPDPYYRENQYAVRDLSLDDYEFERDFDVPETLLASQRIFLRFDGIDTLAQITLNGTVLGRVDNMHRVWEYEAKSLLKRSGNRLHLHFDSPTRYITERQAERPLWGVATTIPGYPYLRKAHYMFGWDWTPQLPDMGIWRPVSLIGADHARIDGVYVTQEHHDHGVDLEVRVDAERFDGMPLSAVVAIIAPDGTETVEKVSLDERSAFAHFTIPDPHIWWPNGYGAQPLYGIKVRLFAGEKELEEQRLRIGLRTIGVSRENDEWGQEFCFLVNGVKIFAMGADYIPEDQIIARCTPEKTRQLLAQCVKVNFNHIRVWGGGYYPEDWFYDLCDEMGLIVWQDFMYACAVYRMDETFTANITQELIDNIKRIRHHACLGIWCGNNEMETAWDSWGIPQEPDLKTDYIYQFEELFPAICQKYDPQTFYWPSSPSCGGGFDDPNSYNKGDVHYWDVWHGMKPLTDFSQYYFRFCSEYGFMSLPGIKTIRAFAEEEDLNLFSAVMEAHQKCDDGTKKLLYYMSQMVPYPCSFEGVIDATQLLQAEAIRANVEHMRRNRGRCMGSTYWQLNDSNPIISWSSIDYFGRWKALHYYARRFYAPVLLSVNKEDCGTIVFNVSNERFEALNGIIKWTLRDNSAEVLRSGEAPAAVPPLTAKDCLVLNLSDLLAGIEERRSRYIEYTLIEGGQIVSRGSSLFVMPKHFHFLEPGIQALVTQEADCFSIRLTAFAYAKSVCLELREADCVFSDNWFDIHGQEEVIVTVPFNQISEPLTLAEFRRQLMVH